MSRRFLKILVVLMIAAISVSLRLYAASRLTVDYDEPVYLDVSIKYANFIREGNFTLIAWDETVYEHPALYKVLNGIALVSQPPLSQLYEKDLVRLSPIQTADARNWVMVGRHLSTAIASIAVIILALYNPLAGLFLGINTLSVNYTSEFYIEALPLLTSLLCILCYSHWFNRVRSGTELSQQNHVWLVASGVFLGMTAAGKYVYCIVGIAIAFHFLVSYLQKQIPRRMFVALIGWGILSIVMFFLFNPYLWPHPVGRLVKTISFHLDYSSSYSVTRYNYPFWQPFLWLSDYLRMYNIRPFDAFLVNIDPFIFGFAVLGAFRLYKKNLLIFIWLVSGLTMLLVWNTKWPQYTLTILVPFCMAASEGVIGMFELAKRTLTSRP